MATVRPARPEDVRLYWEHLQRLYMESGRDGDFIFSPIEGVNETPFEKVASEKLERMKKTPLQTGWERGWVIEEGGRIYGEVRLQHTPPLKTNLHRATLMMGIERSHRARGLGSELMTQAIAWAKDQSTLDWLQLFVFAHNTPARKLYEKFGFQEVGSVPDMFRVYGQQVDDITMILRLR